MAKWLRRQHLRDMKCTVHDLEVMDSNTGRVELDLNIFYSEEMDWARHTTRQCPLKK